ncbi:unnamed protein product [Hapterophycus canaliculatus]
MVLTDNHLICGSRSMLPAARTTDMCGTHTFSAYRGWLHISLNLDSGNGCFYLRRRDCSRLDALDYVPCLWIVSCERVCSNALRRTYSSSTSDTRKQILCLGVAEGFRCLCEVKGNCSVRFVFNRFSL